MVDELLPLGDCRCVGINLRRSFTQDLLNSTHFQQIRDTATTLAGQAEVHAVIQWELTGKLKLKQKNHSLKNDVTCEQ